MFEKIINRYELDINANGSGNLIIFGDSFADKAKSCNEEWYIPGLPEFLHDFKTWQILVAQNINCKKLINYARGGSSLFFSMQSLIHYMRTEYQPNDTIIFVATSGDRLPFLWGDHKDAEAGWHATLLHYLSGNVDKSWPQYSFYNKNNKEVKWIHENFNTDENHIMFLEYIKSHLKSLSNNTLLINAFEDVFSSPNEPIFDTIGFKRGLMYISEKELICKNDPWLYLSKGDWRPNHLLQENHKVLSSQINKYFKFKDKNVFKQNEFHTGCIEIPEFNKVGKTLVKYTERMKKELTKHGYK